jgi:DNA-binding NarL/FixJ family response regulator
VSGRKRERAHAGSAVAVELAIDNPELAERIRTLILEHPDLRLADAGEGEGPTPEVRITDAAAASAPDVAVIVITDRSGAMEALQAGAAAVLSQRTDGEGLHAAIRAAVEGFTTLAGEYRDLLVDGAGAVGGLEGETEEEPAHVDLTPREQQVLQLLAQGASNKTIARRLEITPHTAKFHVASIVAKLAATGRTDAVAKAMRLGLVMI